MDNDKTNGGDATDRLNAIVVPCDCPLCVYGEEPVHGPKTIKLETPPPKGTMERSIWDARGGSAPRMMQRGYA